MVFSKYKNQLTSCVVLKDAVNMISCDYVLYEHIEHGMSTLKYCIMQYNASWHNMYEDMRHQLKNRL